MVEVGIVKIGREKNPKLAKRVCDGISTCGGKDFSGAPHTRGARDAPATTLGLDASGSLDDHDETNA